MINNLGSKKERESPFPFIVVIIKSNFLENIYTPLNFCKEIIKEKINLKVFFLNSACLYANKNVQINPWNDFVNDASLIICSNHAEKYGVNNENILPNFELGTLGQLIEFCEQTDKIITFK